MSKYFKTITGWLTSIAALILSLFTPLAPLASAIGTGLTVSPMLQQVIVNPGEPKQASFNISNPSSAKSELNYELSVKPFFVDEKNSIVYEAEGNMSDIVDWIRFNVPTTGTIQPNGTEEIVFTINPPQSAPAGGQYFSIMVTQLDNGPSSSEDNATNERQAMIKETYQMAHLVYTEVTGNIIKEGKITDVTVPSFLLSGNITGSALIKNTGNVHSDAKYTLQIYPLFSNEEVYTNEENPEKVIILPNRDVFHETSWDNTPTFGIFNVVYTVTFGESVEQVSRMVIVCPIWALFLILFIVAALIIWIIMRIKKHSNSKNNTAE